MSKTYGEQTIEYIKRYMDELIDGRKYMEAEEIGHILYRVIKIYNRHDSSKVKKEDVPAGQQYYPYPTPTWREGRPQYNNTSLDTQPDCNQVPTN